MLGAERRPGGTAICYRRVAPAADGERRHGLRVNPPKHEALRIEAGDTVIVLAEA